MKVAVILIGCGTVGSGFLELLLKKKNLLEKEHNLTCEITGICDLKFGNVYREKGIDINEVNEAVSGGKEMRDVFPDIEQRSTEWIIENGRYDILVEASYTNLNDGEPAYSYIQKALKRGRHVITSNKGPIALHVARLEDLARNNNAYLKYEGTVLSGTPTINLVLNSLAGIEFSKVEGILNGTSNFILTKMGEGHTYENALQEAQQLGYAEAKPDADVEGWDAVAKVCILSYVVFKRRLSIDQVEREGITGISVDDIKQAKSEGKVWKLLAKLEAIDGKLMASVRPEKIDLSHPLAHVSGPINAITFTTDILQTITITGPGAGKSETGYSILIDLLDISRHLEKK